MGHLFFFYSLLLLVFFLSVIHFAIVNEPDFPKQVRHSHKVVAYQLVCNGLKANLEPTEVYVHVHRKEVTFR